MKKSDLKDYIRLFFAFGQCSIVPKRLCNIFIGAKVFKDLTFVFLLAANEKNLLFFRICSALFLFWGERINNKFCQNISSYEEAPLSFGRMERTFFQLKLEKRLV